MMNKLVLKLFLLVLLLLQSCIEAPKTSRNSYKSNTTNTNNNTGTSTGPTFASSETAYWYSSAKVVGTININKNSQNTYLIRGSYVHNYLNLKDTNSVYNYTKQYCLVGKFLSSSYKTFRVRAIPVTTVNGSTIERMLRIDFSTESDNTSACKFPMVTRNGTTSTTDNASHLTSVYSLASICTSCSGTATTNSIALYSIVKNNLTTQLYDLDSSDLKNANFSIQVDLSSNSTTDVSSCNTAACSAKGFDCCIEGQCVKDGSLKTNALNNTEYTQAMADYNSNPLTFINWPNIFNICTNIPHTSTTTSTPSSTAQSLATAQDRLNAFTKNWYCFEDVLNNASNPYARCIGTSSTGTLTAYNEVRYDTVKKCGCSASFATMDTSCSNWTVKPIYKNSVETDANIVDFYCYIPPIENQIGKITNLNVAVSSRTTPHRFYSSTGKNYDFLNNLPASVVQEGDTNFSYMDETNKTGPQNDEFNSKAILGSMIVDLSKSAPAKTINVELGKTYILSTISGTFTPCPNCASDSWFKSFFAHPTTQKGIGLQFSGYSTTRDEYGSNDSLGNYEDTHFGRACYVPMTMIPLSHKKTSDVQTQRLNRLQTQAAFFINGYQKDWYGFNQGALIGSFDGVTWFAVGTARRVTATTSKLFLAYNAPFVDLASLTNTTVNIIPDLASNTAPNVDFNPDLSLKDPLQGSAATCQKFHQCNTDSECVSKLGWEYVCADVSQLKTTWPLFDSEANEIKNEEKNVTLFDVLSNTISTSTTKRCVYRGSGAPCKKDFTYFNSTSSNNPTYQKLFTCAPNFYCANYESNKFNSKVVRSPNELDGINYGMDTDVLGRPKNYVTANSSLPTNVKTNLEYVAKTAVGLKDTEYSDFGMCQPGRYINNTLASTTIRDNLPTHLLASHKNGDTNKKADYISQIGLCAENSSKVKILQMCPVFGVDGNYYAPEKITNSANTSDEITYTDFDLKAKNQNMCSSEAKNSSGTSIFKSIEAGPLSTTNSIVDKTLAADACLRRAGSVCHTDLDCGPNKLHESLAGAAALSYFGGTSAERSYWTESLVCSQADAIPNKSSSKYLDFDLSQNKCCREIGKDFTMFTAANSSDLIPLADMGDSTNYKLDTTKHAFNNPTSSYRYSRYSISESALQDSTTIPQLPTQAPSGAFGGRTISPNENQWRVINETGKNTCCGGGWIRKFADGTHTWPIKNRLTIEASNFNCLNYRSPLAAPDFNSTYKNNFSSQPTKPASASNYINYLTYQSESSYLCRYPYQAGCMQVEFNPLGNEEFKIMVPDKYYASDVVDENENILPTINGSHTQVSRLDTSPILYDSGKAPTMDELTNNPGSITWRYNADVPYLPTIFAPNDSGVYDNVRNEMSNVMRNQDFNAGLRFYLPAYIGYDNTNSFIKNVYIKYYYKNSAPKYQNITSHVATAASCKTAAEVNTPVPLPYTQLVYDTNGGTTPWPEAYAYSAEEAVWCVTDKAATSSYRPVMIVRGSGTLSVSGYAGWDYAGLVIEFETIEGRQNKNVVTPGNALYYLSKLGRLDLLGIPQITYEPIYCTNENDTIMPGILKSNYTNRAYINNNAITANKTLRHTTDINRLYSSSSEEDSIVGNGNKEKAYVYSPEVDHGAVFSGKDFTCCTPLGKTPKNGKASCCSGYSVTKNSKETCALPSGTDLHVYFNKFVSNEGVGKDLPGGGLIDTLIKDLDGDGINDLDDTTAEENIDFISQTGEPKFRQSTQDKIAALGTAFCSSGQILGGVAFGHYPAEPYSGYIHPENQDVSSFVFPGSFVDSMLDADPADPYVKKIFFDQGYRWNHHWYCR